MGFSLSTILSNSMKALLYCIIGLTMASFILPEKHKLRIFMAGDSTMQLYDSTKTPQRGWGQLLPEFFREDVEIHDLARGGRSTKSFIAEGLWLKLVTQLEKGDWVIIEFGHNDHDKRKPERYTPPEDYKRNLIKMVNDVKAKGAFPIVLTPIAMRSFDKNGHYYDGHGAYPGKVKEAAEQTHTPIIDLDSIFGAVVAGMGMDSSKALFMNFGPGLYKAYPQGRKDNTHLRAAGAKKVAALFVANLKRLHLKPINQYLL